MGIQYALRLGAVSNGFKSASPGSILTSPRTSSAAPDHLVLHVTNV